MEVYRLNFEDHEDVHRKIQAAIGKCDELLTLVKKRFGYVSRSTGLAKTILQGTVQGKKRKGRQKKWRETILRSGQGWTLLAQLGQLKTGLHISRLLLVLFASKNLDASQTGQFVSVTLKLVLSCRKSFFLTV